MRFNLGVYERHFKEGNTVSNPNNSEPPNVPDSRAPHWWRQLWPKVKVPLQLIAGQLIGWLLRKMLGE